MSDRPTPVAELRPWERRLLDAAEAGITPSPEDIIALCRSIAFGRQDRRAAALASSGGALAEAYWELVQGFAVLMQQRATLDDQVASLRTRLVAMEAHSRTLEGARSPRLPQTVLAEMRRLTAERDEYRQAARDADAERMALRRQLAGRAA